MVILKGAHVSLGYTDTFPFGYHASKLLDGNYAATDCGHVIKPLYVNELHCGILLLEIVKQLNIVDLPEDRCTRSAFVSHIVRTDITYGAFGGGGKAGCVYGETDRVACALEAEDRLGKPMVGIGVTAGD